MEHSEESKKAKPSFKVIGHIVMAMKRFQAALNPTYTYTKRPASPPNHQAALQAKTMSRTGSGRTASGRTVSGRDAQGKHHGYKGNMLFKPLPALPTEQETQA
ncbi:hypothetical protein HYH02_006033 [Chlamydomonas schloesseri]|uniref:Uncharacterized protein n=1 Tax=Chlamydomonas schloesseri TaxID=2026947 RepID=A0A835WJP9_9CHLO|nr:hypothetical protein HYH02_006033 [Chlamydomonas schloesseri]|eukprot:KAG2448676.1 hypothetical protein HYH02_006033 [Chlamydomonas schloesseri]